MSESLLGVILATSSSRGHHIVFRWPNNPKLFKRYSKVKYYTESRPSHSNRAHLEDELDPVRQKARWDHHDEDQDENGNIDSVDAGQSDTPSSSDVDESDGSMPDDDDNRSARDRAETVASHDRSKTGAARSASRSKSKSRRPLLSMEEASPSVRSTDRQTGALKEAPDANDRAPDSEAGTSKELSPEEKARREEKAARAYKTYLGYDIDILASILNPRPELSHKKFELVIDDLAFLGHPVTPNKNGVWGDQDDESQDDRVEARDEKTAAHAQQRGRSGLRKEIRPYDPSDDRVASNDKIDKSAKTGAKSRNASLTRIEQTNDIPTSRSKAPLTQFHLVLILDRPDPSTAVPGVDLSSWLQLFYDNIVFKMTAALFAEQSKSDYVGRETEKLLALRERCMDDGQAYAAYAAQCLGISSLARCIRDLHKSISISSDAFLTINDRIEVHLQLPPILQDPSSLAKTVDIETELDPNDPIFLSGGGFEGLGKEGAHQDGSGGTYKRRMAMTPAQLSFEEWCRTTGPYLLPWKTLLLLHDQVDEAPNRERAKSDTCSPAGLASPGEGASQALEAHGFDQLARKFTSFFTPSLYNTPNFSQVADMLGWDLYDDVYPMVRHLIYYRQARVIDVPRPGHVYAISPLFDFARLGSLSYNWAQTFPDVAPLPVFLSQLSSSTSRTLSNLFPARHQRELALEVLIWLLRHEVVVKMHIRLRLIATESVKRRTAERRVERHERHRARKEKKRQRAAELEARRMRKSQSEEQQRRRAAEQAEQAKQADEQQAQGHQRLTEERGRSRDRERSSSGEARQLGSSERKEQDDDAAGRVDAAEGDVQTSGLSVSRPPILADPDSVAQASAIAAAAVGSGGEVRRSGDHEHERQHHHHHHHQHAPQHRHHHRRHQNTSDPITGTDSTAAPSDKAPIPIAPRSQFDELKFERRPVLRSRSPSTAMAAGASAGLSVSFSNLSERGEITRRARADTTGSSSSGGGLRHSRTRGDAISMTPTTSQHSRPSTPNVVGRIIPSHVRDRSIGGGGSNVSSSAEGGSVPRRARRTTSSAGWGGRTGIPRSRSPSRARMRVKGFGADAEVEIDDDDDDGDEREEEVEEVMAMDEDVEQQDCGANELASELDLLCLDKGGKSERKKRRISSASERPELPPPSESHGSEGGNKSRSEGVLSSSCSTSSSGVTTLSELSLSSDLDSEAVDSNLDSNVHESQYGQTHRPSPLSSTSISPTSPTHTHRFGNHSRISTHSRATHAHTPRGSAYSDSLIVEPARASRRENEYIATMVENKDATTTKLFFRLLPYLNGKHTIDEIEYRVLMRRRHIRRLLKTFRESIITFMHP